MALQPETRLGPYEVVSIIGAGGMGEVYRGRGSPNQALKTHASYTASRSPRQAPAAGVKGVLLTPPICLSDREIEDVSVGWKCAMLEKRLERHVNDTAID